MHKQPPPKLRLPATPMQRRHWPFVRRGATRPAPLRPAKHRKKTCYELKTCIKATARAVVVHSIYEAPMPTIGSSSDEMGVVRHVDDMQNTKKRRVTDWKHAQRAAARAAALRRGCEVPNRGLQPTAMPSLGLGACRCCDKTGRPQLKLRRNVLDDPAHGTMLAANWPGVMHLATVSGFATTPLESWRAGFEPLGGRSRNGCVQN